MTDAKESSSPLPDPGRLPHGPGFRFVTAVDKRQVSEDGASQGTGRWELTGEESFFSDHFPQRPILPGVLLIESLAQFSGLIHFASVEGIGRPDVGIASVDVRLLRPVMPPATLILQATSRETAGPLTRFDVSASVDGKRVARGSLHLTASIQGEQS
jgi:3-hydroxyacyl-[acyl-carrier-protein] dehydratase